MYAGPHNSRFESDNTRTAGAQTREIAETGEQRHAFEGEAPTYETGTTIVALSADDGVVMAADKRMSLGGQFTASKDVQKISTIHPTGMLAISGSVGPAQQLVQSLRAETSLYERRHDDPMSMTALSRTAGHLVRGLPVHPLLAGVDETGGHVYELDGGGSVIEDTYAASGSGMQTAYGLLEGRVGDSYSIPDAQEIAVDAVLAASERDTASGNGVTVGTATSDTVTIEAVEDPDATSPAGDLGGED
jgi:proteasome beta subunit